MKYQQQFSLISALLGFGSVSLIGYLFYLWFWYCILDGF